MGDTPRTNKVDENYQAKFAGRPPPHPEEPDNAWLMCGKLEQELATAVKQRDHLQSMFDVATEIQGDDEAIKYVTSGNSVPVTRCTVSADLLRQLIEGRAAAVKRAEVAEIGLTAVLQLIDESYGVAGLHKNGDVAPWSELRTGGRFEEWLLDFDEAINNG